ncbi:hypothetical protein STBA_28800 [Streptomyces sp. MP131-18]|nr:hypothetical protein STBA_28800 [Streptomyces sp. MP131-18]
MCTYRTPRRSGIGPARPPHLRTGLLLATPPLGRELRGRRLGRIGRRAPVRTMRARRAGAHQCIGQRGQASPDFGAALSTESESRSACRLGLSFVQCGAVSYRLWWAGRLYASPVARTLPTSRRAAGRRFLEPGSRTGPGRDGFGARAGEPVLVRRLRNPRRTRAGVSLFGLAGFSQGRRRSVARAAKPGIGPPKCLLEQARCVLPSRSDGGRTASSGPHRPGWRRCPTTTAGPACSPRHWAVAPRPGG